MSYFIRWVKGKIEKPSFLYGISNILTPAVGIILGPMVLRKVGISTYGLLGLATYFLGLATIYTDLGSYSHLLVQFSKSAAERFEDLGNALILKILLFLAFFGALYVYAHFHPRADYFYLLLMAYLMGVLPATMNVEWYFIARNRYLQYFYGRIILNLVSIGLLTLWYFSEFKNPLFVPIIGVMATVSGMMYYMFFGAVKVISRTLLALKLASFRGLRTLVVRLLPIVAIQIVAPYTLPYAMVWFSFSTSDQKKIGAFSIAYRLAIGCLSLVGPFVFFTMAEKASSYKPIHFRKIFGFSILSVGSFFILGAPVLWWYFWKAHLDHDLFYFALSSFSILLLGVFCVALRTVFVSECLLSGQYLRYFVIHAGSALPILALSLSTVGKVPIYLVPWAACLPDFFITTAFYFTFRFVKQRSLVTLP